MATQESFPVVPFFGGFVLETLTVGMYGESKNAIREYIQNGFDGIQQAIKKGLIGPAEGLIEIKLGDDDDSLVIRDNGIGIGVKHAGATLTRVGASTKDPATAAGFRGIGRLAGIGFSNTVSFKTKAKGENKITVVEFSGDKMRTMMAPKNGSAVSAEELLRLCTKGWTEETSLIDEHYFEVTLNGFVDAPEECTSAELMEEFVSQIAPVGYKTQFPYRKRLAEAEAASGLPIDEIRLTIESGGRDPKPVYKPYTDTYLTLAGSVKLAECFVHISDDKNWWCWIGKKKETGAYNDPVVSGLRVRMKNIQIDGTDVVRDIFKTRAKSHIRFQDWFVGEFFVRPAFLVPNARRDGFEETSAWKTVKADLSELIKELGKETYEISNAGQLSTEAIEKKVTETKAELDLLRRSDFRNVDRVLELSVSVTKLQRKIASASKDADTPVLAELQALNSELIDVKTEAVSKIGDSATKVDREEIEQETKDEFLLELLTLFEEELPPTCFVQVRNLLQQRYDISA